MVKIIASNRSLERITSGINEELAILFGLGILKRVEVVQCRSEKVWKREHAEDSLGVCYSDSGKIYLSPELLSFEYAESRGIVAHDLAHRYHDTYNYHERRKFDRGSDVIDRLFEKGGFKKFRANPQKYEKSFTDYVSGLFASETVANLASFILGYDTENFLEAKGLNDGIAFDCAKRRLDVRDISLAVLNGTPLGLGDLRKMSYTNFVVINNLYDRAAYDFGCLTAFNIVNSFSGNRIAQARKLRELTHASYLDVVTEFAPKK
ncbi:Uncharacterised protein [uncultured archaeon]|nr:Uncharacterised protein [uncultured archaeon]